MRTGDEEREVLEALDRLGIAYVRHEHPPVFTVEDAEKHWGAIEGVHCKNLFLRNSKGDRHYLVIAEVSRNIDLRGLSLKLEETRLSFGSPDRLKKHLGLEPGSVSPFGLIYDPERKIRVIVDAGILEAAKVCFHPNINTATLELTFADFRKFLDWRGNSVEYIRF